MQDYNSNYRDMIRCEDGANVYWIPRKILQRALFDYKITEEKVCVRYATGAQMYDMSERQFRKMAEDAGAIYRPGERISLVKLSIFESYLECFREQ